MPKLDKRFLQRIRVPLGFLFAAVFFIFARPTPTTLAIGCSVAAAGLAIRGWASGHIRKASVLAVTGPYAYTRNPLYLGTLLLGVGFTIASGVWWLAILLIALLLGIYLPVMRVEAADMRRIFGPDFEVYEQNVPLLIPRSSPWKKAGGAFDFQLYLRYREYRALVGALFAAGILAAKAYYFA